MLYRTDLHVTEGCFVMVRKAEANDLPELRSSPGHLVRRARQFHDAIWIQRIGEQLTPVQVAVLTALANEDGLDQTSLGERVAKDKSTIGELISRLVRRGDVVQDTDPTDARRRMLHLTPQGLAVLRAAAPDIYAVGRDLLAPLSPNEQRELMRLLDKLVFSEEAQAAVRSARGSGQR